MDSWLAFEACEEIPYESIKRGASVIPLGELFTIKRNGKYKLKITHWFEMQTTFEGTPFPQANEGIEKVAWLNPEQIKEARKNSYENIKLLFEEEKLLK